MHPLDTHDRRELAQGAAGIGMCNITKCCTEVCPEGIKITDNAIIPMKERVVDKKFDPLVWLGNKIGVRTKDYDGRTEVCSDGCGARAVPQHEGRPSCAVRKRGSRCTALNRAGDSAPRAHHALRSTSVRVDATDRARARPRAACGRQLAVRGRHGPGRARGSASPASRGSGSRRSSRPSAGTSSTRG